MQLFASEIIQAYTSYSFGYCCYAVREPHDHISKLYDQGFLPYSGAQDVANVFYMARSLRLPLADFALNSENRRIFKRFETELDCECTPFADFNHKDPTFIAFCLRYFGERHGPHIMPEARLHLILTSNLITTITTYKHNGTPVAYVFKVEDAHMSHFWYSFYDLSFINQSLGLWLMIHAGIQAKEQGKQFFYLGTAYGEKGLYKTNFDNLHYWNGASWVSDRNQLRERCKSDTDRTLDIMDEWKQTNSHLLF